MSNVIAIVPSQPAPSTNEDWPARYINVHDDLCNVLAEVKMVMANIGDARKENALWDTLRWNGFEAVKDIRKALIAKRKQEEEAALEAEEEAEAKLYERAAALRKTKATK
jgi:hypothetical protein